MSLWVWWRECGERRQTRSRFGRRGVDVIHSALWRRRRNIAKDGPGRVPRRSTGEAMSSFVTLPPMSKSGHFGIGQSGHYRFGLTRGGNYKGGAYGGKYIPQNRPMTPVAATITYLPARSGCSTAGHAKSDRHGRTMPTRILRRKPPRKSARFRHASSRQATRSDAWYVSI